jgi:hypothetical protein
VSRHRLAPGDDLGERQVVGPEELHPAVEPAEFTLHLLQPELLDLGGTNDHQDGACVGQEAQDLVNISAGSCSVATVVSFSANVPLVDEAAVDAGDERRRGGKSSWRKLLGKSGGGPADCYDQLQPVRFNADRIRCTMETSGASPLARAGCTETSVNWMGSRDDRIRSRMSASANPIAARTVARQTTTPARAWCRRVPPPSAEGGAATPRHTPGGNRRGVKRARADSAIFAEPV